ncbi:MAG: GWxTD domain-containing protein [Gemmatimonadales bacterium]
MSRLLLVLLVGALLGPGVSAQSAPERAKLDVFRDSLAVITDTASLQQLETALMRDAKTQGGDPMLHLRLGFLSLRLGDLGALRYYNDAASEFQSAVQLEPSWPYGWFALGLAEYELGEVQGPDADRTTLLGRNASGRAATAYMRAALADPAFAARLEVLAAQAVRRRDADRGRVVLDALRQALATQPPGVRAPAILLALGRVEREVGDLPAALNAFETYRRVGDNRALGLLEVARTRFLLGDLAGTEAYYEGAAIDDLVALAAYRADLEVVASDSVLGLFDRLRGQPRSKMLATFWGGRDRLDFRREGSRLREHYRRLAMARQQYSAGGWSLPSDPAFLSTEAVLDDRGRLYVRHGEPDSRVSFNAVGVEPNESWHYRRAGGDLVFHFVARQDPDRFRLVESLFDVVDMRLAMASSGERPGAARGEPAGASEQLFRSREGLAAVYADLGTPGRADGRQAEARERALVQTSLEIGLATDSYEPRYPRALAARLHAVATTRVASGPAAHLLIAVPGFGLELEEFEGLYVYPMRLVFVGLDATGAVQVEIDTILRPATATPVRPDRFLQVHFEVPLTAASTLTYRMGLFAGANGGSVSPIDTIRTLPADAVVPRLGDLILGAPSSRLMQDGVTFGPMQSISRSERLELFAEATGLAGDGRYRASFELRDPETGAMVFDQQFTGRLEGGRGAIAQRLSLRGAPPGRYVAALVVTDQGGRSTQVRQRLQVTIP